MLINNYLAYLAAPLNAAGGETTIFVDRITTILGETVQTADFAAFARGILTVNPEGDGLTSYPEQVSFTAVDGTELAFTGAIRGLDKNSASQSTFQRYHPTNTPVVISIGCQNIADLKAYIDAAVAGTIGTASDTVAGSTKLTKNLGTLARAQAALVVQQVSAGLTVQVAPFAIGDFVYAGGNSPTFVAPVSNPRIDLLAYDKVLAALIIKQGSEAASPAVPQMSGDYIPLAYIYNRVAETSIKDTSDGTNGYIYMWCEPVLLENAGFVKEIANTTVPTGHLNPDGSSFSTVTYPELARALAGIHGYGTGIVSTFTAATDIVNATAHGFVNGQPVFFGNSGGALPGGLSANTPYYVINAATNTFQVSATKGGSAVNITDAGSGTNTSYGNMLLPNKKGSVSVGSGQRVSTATIVSIAGNILTVSGPVNNANNHWQTGQAVVFHATVAGNLVNSTTYYLVRISNTSFALATNLANAQGQSAAGATTGATVITLAGTETGNFTLTMTSRALGETGGEESHADNALETLAHSHITALTVTAGSGASANLAGSSAGLPTNPFGGNAAKNNMQPFVVMNYAVRY